MRIGALLRIEVERAFKSRMFWLMLLLGIVITGIEFVIAPLRYSKDIIGTFDGSIGNTINTVFNSWFFSLQKNAIPLRQLYIMIMPLMAVFDKSNVAFQHNDGFNEVVDTFVTVT